MDNESKLFASHAAFFREAYAPHVRREVRLAAAGSVLLDVVQPAGTFTIPATPDLVVGVHASSPTRCQVSWGSGRFGGQMTAGMAVVCPPNAEGRISIAQGNAAKLLSIPYDSLLDLAGDQAELLPADGDFGHVHETFVADGQVSGTVEALWNLSGATEEYVPLLVQSQLLLLAGTLLKLGRQPASRTGRLGAWRIKKLVDYVNERLDEDLSLGELSQVAALSPFHFSRTFKNTFGTTPHQWVLSQRIERAKQMMAAAPRATLSEIAAAVGFSSHSAFSKAFQRVTGVTPSDWRRQV